MYVLRASTTASLKIVSFTSFSLTIVKHGRKGNQKISPIILHYYNKYITETSEHCEHINQLKKLKKDKNSSIQNIEATPFAEKWHFWKALTTTLKHSIDKLVIFLKGCKFDFEDHNEMDRWVATGTAFNNQPTYGDNSTARHRDQPSQHQGQYWIGGYENRPFPASPGGAIQGDRPQELLHPQSLK